MRTIGRYEVESEIGRGGMGAVFKGRDPALGRPVAIKLLLGFRNPKARRRFQTEVQTLGKVRHPNVVGIHASGEHEGVPYLVMDWVEGSSLEQRIEREGPLEEREAADLILQLAEALAEIHAEGVLHRDLKPSNVLLARDGTPLLTDFGLAKDLAAEISGSMASMQGAFLGTPGFLPPEQARGDLQRVGPRSDVYGLGATLFCMLTGEAPYTGANPLEVLAAMESPPRLPSGIRPQLDRRLEQICMRCLARDPEQRFPDAMSLADELEAFLHGAPSGLRAGPVAATALLVLGALGAAAFVLTGSGGATPSDGAPATTQTPAGEADVATRARILMDAEGWDQAAALLTQALAERPEDPQLYLLRCEARRAAGDGEGAEADASSAIALDANLAGAWIARARSRAARRDWPGALADAERAIDLEPSVAHQLARARIRREQGDLEGGITDATTALARDPRSAEALTLRGQLWFELQDVERAQLDLRKALELDPQRGPALRYLAALEVQRRRFEDALPWLELVTRQADATAGDWHDLGVAHAALGHADLALQAFLTSRELDPDLPEPWLQRGMLLNNLRRFQEALTELTEAARLAPSSAVVLMQRGIAYTGLDQHASAAQDFLRVLELDPGQLDAMFNLGLCLRNQGQNEEAERALSAFLSQRPDDRGAYEVRADLYRLLGRADAALADYGQALALGAGLEVHERRYRYLRELERREEALPALEAWIAACSPPPPGMLYELLGLELGLGRLEPAIEAALRFARATPETLAKIADEGDPQDPELWAQHAAYQASRANDVDALLYLSWSLALDDQRWQVWADRALLRERHQDPEGALRDLDAARALAPDEALIHYHRFRTLKQLGQLLLARESLARAVELDPQMAKGWFALAEEVNKEDPARAIEAYGKLLALEPDHAAGLNNLALLLLEQGHAKAALPPADRLVELLPDDLNARLTRARIRQQLADNEGALADYERVRELDPGAWQGWVGAGQLLRLIGRYAEAEPALTRALELLQNPVLNLQRADAREKLGMFVEAAEDYATYLEQRPNEHRTRLKQAQALERGERYAEALVVYRQLAEEADDETALKALERVAALRAEVESGGE